MLPATVNRPRAQDPKVEDIFAMNVSLSLARRASLRIALVAGLPLLLLASFADTGRAQAFGMMTPAATLAKGSRAISAGAVFSDEAWGPLGHARRGFGAGWDFGLQIGAASYDDTPLADGPSTFLIAVDGRKQIREAGPDQHVDVSLGLGFGIETGSDLTRIIVLPQASAGHRIVYDDHGRAVTPYGSLGLGIENVSIGPFEDTDIDLRARIGGLWEPSPRLGLAVEFGFGGERGNSMLASVRWPF